MSTMTNRNSSRTHLMDTIEAIANLNAMVSHYKECVQDLHITQQETGDLDIREDINKTLTLLHEANDMRRQAMRLLEDEKSDKNHWCAVKHSITVYMTMWETYEATKEKEWLDLALRSSELMSKQIGLWLGIEGEMEGCLRCLGDRLKGVDEE